jgi:hypothetical protein
MKTTSLRALQRNCSSPSNSLRVRVSLLNAIGNIACFSEDAWVYIRQGYEASSADTFACDVDFLRKHCLGYPFPRATSQSLGLPFAFSSWKSLCSREASRFQHPKCKGRLLDNRSMGSHLSVRKRSHGSSCLPFACRAVQNDVQRV